MVKTVEPATAKVITHQVDGSGCHSDHPRRHAHWPCRPLSDSLAESKEVTINLCESQIDAVSIITSDGSLLVINPGALQEFLIQSHVMVGMLHSKHVFSSRFESLLNKLERKR